jgi:diguanylate cyclase (GGDEF)-like protein
MHASIDIGLSRPWYRLRLPSALEVQYRAEMDRSSGRYIQSWLAIFAIFNVLSLLLDYDVFGPDAFQVPLALTMGMFCPVVLIAILSLRGSPTMLRMTGAVLATVLVDIAIVLNSARLAPPGHANSYIILAAIVPLVVGLIAPLPFRHTVVYCICSLALYAGLILAFGLTGHGQAGLPLLVSGLILVPLKLGYSREWESRKVFLLGLREKLQAGALARANARLTVLSETDSLTHLPNRRHFSEQLDGVWQAAADEGQWLGVVFVDIDHFKLFNDTAGHHAGDECLVAVAGALSSTIEARGGLVARYGGEEFVAYLPRVDLGEAIEAGEAIRAAVTQLALPHPGLRAGAQVAVSVGVTSAHGPARAFGMEAKDLLRAADLALYRAKTEGRNRVAALGTAANSNRAPTDGSVASDVP